VARGGDRSAAGLRRHSGGAADPAAGERGRHLCRAQKRAQKSINLALGSSLATIGLTIPAVAVAAYALDKTLVLGLDQRETVLLVMTLLISMLTFGTGRTNILFGLVHMLVFAVFVFMVFVP